MGSHCFSKRARALAIVTLCFLVSSMTGCSTVRFAWQAARGQLKLSSRARPIAEVIADQRTPTVLRELLGEVGDIKRFGESMGLRATRNYETYVSWDDDAVSWVVAATPALSFEPRVWSFPVVGSFTYLGWFDREAALKQARSIRAEGGSDVIVRGAQAFSTLGWFRDPIVSTMLGIGRDALLPRDTDAARLSLIEVVLHESVHATFYVADQSAFNESLADWVANRLTREYLQTKSSALAERYLATERKAATQAKLYQQAYGELAQLYARMSEPESVRQEAKRRIYAGLSRELGMGEWNAEVLNNAALLQYRTYGLGRAEFEALWQREGASWERFWCALGGLRESKGWQRAQDEEFGVRVNAAQCTSPKRG